MARRAAECQRSWHCGADRRNNEAEKRNKADSHRMACRQSSWLVIQNQVAEGLQQYSMRQDMIGDPLTEKTSMSFWTEFSNRQELVFLCLRSFTAAAFPVMYVADGVGGRVGAAS